MNDVTISLVEQAADLLRGVAKITPVLTSRTLDQISGTQAFLKCENFQLVGAFKFRGAYHAVTRLIAGHSASAFATISSGNHAQGLALACRLQGATAHVVLPKPFSAMKYQAVLDYGATVLVAESRAQAEVKLREVTEGCGAMIVHPFNDPLVIAGQGTIMVELLNQVKDLDAVIAPVGGGGLLSGLAVVAENRRPQMKIFACEPAGALDAIESVRQNRVVPMLNPDTIADGLRTSLGSRTLPILRRCLAGFFIVQEEEIIQAMRFAYERLKLVIEPSSAVALAPLLRKEARLVGKRVAVVLSGGNADLSLLWEGLRGGSSR
ncbi:MAG TPA: pyridoxal-phosphate dependent enzyme [Nitrospira sp.]|nr:pyridoxal-phosphate dependent enzyme [Nitrospira sp.]